LWMMFYNPIYYLSPYILDGRHEQTQKTQGHGARYEGLNG
jgi:hypothetical protein